MPNLQAAKATCFSCWIDALHHGLKIYTACIACSVGAFRRHPPEDMEDMVPRLRSVAAEIETPRQSPRSGVTSPNSDSGDSFTKSFMHQARRFRSAVLNQKVRLCANSMRLAFMEKRKCNLHHAQAQARMSLTKRIRYADVSHTLA